MYHRGLRTEKGEISNRSLSWLDLMFASLGPFAAMKYLGEGLNRGSPIIPPFGKRVAVE